MLATLASPETGFYHIDLRDVLQDTTTDWANELHPTDFGFHKVAERFADRIDAVLAPMPVGI